MILGFFNIRQVMIFLWHCVHSRPDYALVSSDEESDDDNQVQEEPETPMQVITLFDTIMHYLLSEMKYF